jgi:hypothetical protein
VIPLVQDKDQEQYLPKHVLRNNALRAEWGYISFYFLTSLTQLVFVDNLLISPEWLRTILSYSFSCKGWAKVYIVDN